MEQYICRYIKCDCQRVIISSEEQMRVLSVSEGGGQYFSPNWILFNVSNGRIMHSTVSIHSIFERNLSFIIINHPAKFHKNWSRTFWDNRGKHSHTDRHNDADENNTCPKTKFLGQLKMLADNFRNFDANPINQQIKIFVFLRENDRNLLKLYIFSF